MSRMSELSLKALIDRLVWPSSLVREKVCRAVGDLLASGTAKEIVEDGLLRWMEEQELESSACLAILALLRAQTLAPAISLPSAELLMSHVRVPSILSYELLRRLGIRADRIQVPVADMHGADVPSGFVRPAFFDQHVKEFLPPVYWERAQFLAETLSIPFLNQWAFEWAEKVHRLGIELNTDVFSYWGYYRGPRIQASDARLSEIYRSAYLRTLAWAVDKGWLDLGGARTLALRTCPVDVGLWAITPSRQPEWWPSGEKRSLAIEDAPVQIGHAVRELWEETTGELEEGKLLGVAAGRIGTGNTVYDLRIHGVIQKCVGPTQPDIEKIVSWNASQVVTGIQGMDLLDNARLEVGDHQSEPRAYGDWLVYPLACQIDLPTVPRWHYWRLYHGIWAPNPHIVEGEIAIDCSSSELAYREDSDLLGSWSDWVEELRERDMPDVPPFSGSVLLLERAVVEDLAGRLHGNYCWLVELRAFHRNSAHENVEQIPSYLKFGTQRLVTP